MPWRCLWSIGHRPLLSTNSILGCCLHFLSTVFEACFSHLYLQISFPCIFWSPYFFMSVRCPIGFWFRKWLSLFPESYWIKWAFDKFSFVKFQFRAVFWLHQWEFGGNFGHSNNYIHVMISQDDINKWRFKICSNVVCYVHGFKTVDEIVVRFFLKNLHHHKVTLRLHIVNCTKFPSLS